MSLFIAAAMPVPKSTLISVHRQTVPAKFFVPYESNFHWKWQSFKSRTMPCEFTKCIFAWACLQNTRIWCQPQSVAVWLANPTYKTSHLSWSSTYLIKLSLQIIINWRPVVSFTIIFYRCISICALN